MPPKKNQPTEPEEPEEGSGSYVFEDGAKYTGQWTMITVAEGQDKVMQRHGKGKMMEHGNLYDGEWVQDAMEGQGCFTFKDTSNYTGTWLRNRYEGRGAFKWPDGSAYDGQWRAGLMHGEGKYTDLNGKLWHGKFYNGTGPGLCRAC